MTVEPSTSDTPDYTLPPALELALDKNIFKKNIIVFAVGRSLGQGFRNADKKLRDFTPGYIALPKLKTIYVDDNGVKRKLFLIRQITEEKELDELRQLDIQLPESPLEEISYLETHPDAYVVEKILQWTDENGLQLPSRPCAFRLPIGYENLTFDKTLKEVLPKDMDAVTGFSLIGHLAHFNLKPPALPYRKLIGQIAIDKLYNVKTVVNKAAKIDTEFRTFAVDLMAGKPDYLTQVQENGVTFHLDFSQVYWNTRLGTEHSRIVNEVKGVVGMHQRMDPSATVVVYDVFAGVGPFAIPLARVDGCRVLANDLNPASFKFLQENVRRNSSRKHCLTEDNIKCSNLDGRDFIAEVLQPHYEKAINSQPTPSDFFMLMNLPGLAIEFLDAFRDFSPNVTTSPLSIQTRCYCFVRHSLEGSSKKTQKAAEADVETRARVCAALEIPAENISTTEDPTALYCDDDGDSSGLRSSIHLTSWKVRFVRNTAPLRDMYCLEFRLHFPVVNTTKKPRIE